MRAAGDSLHGQRLRGLIVVLWRAGWRISEALTLAESGLDARRGAVRVRRGNGGRRREGGMDHWAWDELQPWLASRLELPVEPLFCVVNGPTTTVGQCATLQRQPEFAGASHRINSATRMPSRWPARVSR
jgi:site-specific recombinase XerC